MTPANMNEPELPAPPEEKEIAAPVYPPDDSKNLIFILLGFLLIALSVAAAFVFWAKPTQTSSTTKITPFPTLQILSTTPSPTVTSESTQSANWKTYNSPCGFGIKYPNDWNAQKYFIQDSNESCAYITAPDYKSGQDSRSGLYVSISKTALGTKSKTITINSLDNYITSLENVSEPPTLVKNKQDKTYGLYQGKQFDLGLFESQTQFVFIKNNNIYSVLWPSTYTGIYKNLIDQILSTFKFLDQVQPIDYDANQLNNMAKNLMINYLDGFKSKNDTDQSKITDYQIESITINKVYSNMNFVFGVYFSVKPVRVDYWSAGNGSVDNDGWIRHKYQSVIVVKENGQWKISGMGTGGQ